MNAPNKDDDFVNVTAYMTDEHFGYDHWRATQFRAGMPSPGSDVQRPALLVICDSERARDAVRLAVERALTPVAVEESNAARANAFAKRTLAHQMQELFVTALLSLDDEKPEERFVLATIAKALRDVEQKIGGA